MVTSVGSTGTGRTKIIWESVSGGPVKACICVNREMRAILWPSYLAARMKPNQWPSSVFDAPLVLVKNRFLLRGCPALLGKAARLGCIRRKYYWGVGADMSTALRGGASIRR